MPKRKRSNEDELDEKWTKHRQELFKQLKVAKGFERQRMSKRINDPKSTAEKKIRIDREITVLKSIELQQVAHAHLCSSLLKIKGVAESPSLPDEIKNGVPKPEISEEERIALHNVTSALYNQEKVRQALEKAVADICRTLNVPVPDKKGKAKRERGDKKSTVVKDEKVKQSTEKKPAPAQDDASEVAAPSKKASSTEEQAADEDEDEDEDEWNGVSDPEEEERAIARLDELLGSSSESDGDDEGDNDEPEPELDPMEISDYSGSEASDAEISLAEDGSEVSKEESGESEESEESDGSHVSPPPKAAPKKAKKEVEGRATNSSFIPSLMGGYISGSDSEASDVDVAPAMRKNRRGQKARQKIWEQKFGGGAKHLAKEAPVKDAVWDPKRGAVDGSDKRPWKRGIRNVFNKSVEDNPNSMEVGEKKKKPPKKDDDGILHPSWEAMKKKKEAQQTATFQGKKVVFG